MADTQDVLVEKGATAVLWIIGAAITLAVLGGTVVDLIGLI